MKTKIITLLLILLTIGLTSAIDVTAYDRDENGIIDATERINLDIDVEDCRLTPAEILVIDAYTTDNSIILTEEFKAAFLSPETYPPDIVTEVTTMEISPVDDQKAPVNAAQPDTEPVDPGNVTATVPEDDVNSSMAVFFVIGVLILAGVILYMYSKQTKEE